MNQKLNEAQKKLVEENHNLIYKYLNSRKLSLDSIEDWYGTAAIGLCKAALIFDPSRGTKFSTLAYICMDNDIRRIMRDSRKNVTVAISLDEDLSDTQGLRLADAIPDPYDFCQSVYLNDAVSLAVNKLNDRDRQFINLIINEGMTHAEIARQFGVSRTLVSGAYGKLINSVKNYFNN